MDHDIPVMDEPPYELAAPADHPPPVPGDQRQAPLTKEMLQLLSSQQHQRLAKKAIFSPFTPPHPSDFSPITHPQASDPPTSPTHSHYSHHSAPARILVPTKRKGSCSSQGSGMLQKGTWGLWVDGPGPAQRGK